MTSDDRIAILARLVDQAPEQKLGRTAVMKLTYFLQELKGIPLGYDFRLYTYGPFDSDVLSDLATATTHDILKESTILYPRGYGYEITPDAGTAKASARLAECLPEVAAAADQVVAEFGTLGAADLELRSTILFVDAERFRQSQAATAKSLAEQVHRIKPHFSEMVILTRVEEFGRKGSLKSISKVTGDSSTA